MITPQTYFLVIFDKPLSRDEIANLRSKCIGQQREIEPLFEPRHLAITYQAIYGIPQLADVNAFACWDEAELTMLKLCETPSYVGTWTETELFNVISYSVGIIEMKEVKDAFRRIALNTASLRKTYFRLGISGNFPIFNEAEVFDEIEGSEENLLTYVRAFFEDRRVKTPAIQA